MIDKTRDIKTNILKTLIWFDMMNWPLLESEILFWQKSHASQTEVSQTLAELTSNSQIEQTNGLFYLPGHKSNLDNRATSLPIAQAKIKKAIRATRIIRHLPFVQGVFICNALSQGITRPDDDIDFFIITAPGRIWSARFWTTGIFKVLGRRPNLKKNKIADRLCFSFYLAEDGLNLKSIKLPYDPYLENWALAIEPLWLENTQVLEKFYKANRWLDYKNNPAGVKGQHLIKNTKKSKIKTLLEKIHSSQVEKILKKIQMAIMPKILKNKAQHKEGVVISDNMLKFHLQDYRQQHADEYFSKIKTNEFTKNK